jgi:hypothetical protein
VGVVVASGDRSLKSAGRCAFKKLMMLVQVKKKKSERWEESEKKVEKLFGFNTCPLFS